MGLGTACSQAGVAGNTQPYLGITQGVEDTDEGQQGSVDAGPFPKPLTPGVGSGRPLRAHQISQAHLGHLEGLRWPWHMDLLPHKDLG